jgi:hypothetical protein
MTRGVKRNVISATAPVGLVGALFMGVLGPGINLTTF